MTGNASTKEITNEKNISLNSFLIQSTSFSGPVAALGFTKEVANKQISLYALLYDFCLANDFKVPLNYRVLFWTGS